MLDFFPLRLLQKRNSPIQQYEIHVNMFMEESWYTNDLLKDKTVHELLSAILATKRGDEIAETQGVESVQAEVLQPVKSQDKFS